MAFWKENTTEPARKFRFHIVGDEGIWFWAKSVDKPSFEVNSNEYLLINHKFKYPGVLTWSDITITMVNTGTTAEEIEGYLFNSRYIRPSDNDQTDDGLIKNGYDGKEGVLQIQQLDSAGAVIEDWHLYGAFLKSVNHGQLEYSSDELVEIQMVISYDYASTKAEGESSPSDSSDAIID